MKENNPLVSIIIPVWNTARYLQECLDSVLAQTYDRLEILLINDGSTDNSLEICEEYQNKDKRIILIDKENTGVSDTRNIGLEKVSGDYILFVDSDDIVALNHVQLLIETAKKYDSDITIGGLTHFNDGELINCNLEYNFFTYTLNKLDTLKEMLFGKDFSWSISNKLYSKSCIKNIRFLLDQKIGEDLTFFCSSIVNSNVISVSKNKSYYYRSRLSSATKNYKITKSDSRFRESFYYFIKKYFPNNMYLLDCFDIINYMDFYLANISIINDDLELKKICINRIKNSFFRIFFIENKNVLFKFKVKSLIFLISPKLFLYLKKIYSNVKFI